MKSYGFRFFIDLMHINYLLIGNTLQFSWKNKNSMKKFPCVYKLNNIISKKAEYYNFICSRWESRGPWCCELNYVYQNGASLTKSKAKIVIPRGWQRPQPVPFHARQNLILRPLGGDILRAPVATWPKSLFTVSLAHHSHHSSTSLFLFPSRRFSAPAATMVHKYSIATRPR